MRRFPTHICRRGLCFRRRQLAAVPWPEWIGHFGKQESARADSTRFGDPLESGGAEGRFVSLHLGQAVVLYGIRGRQAVDAGLRSRRWTRALSRRGAGHTESDVSPERTL